MCLNFQEVTFTKVDYFHFSKSFALIFSEILANLKLPFLISLTGKTHTINYSAYTFKDLSHDPISFHSFNKKPSHPHYNTYKISLLCRSVNRALFVLWLTSSATVISLFLKINNNFTVIKLCHPLKKQEWHSYSVSLRLRSGLWAFEYAKAVIRVNS